MSIPSYKELKAEAKDIDSINELKENAQLAAYNLLVSMNKINGNLQVATSESLTAGLIMSTLVDIPWEGRLKYGCFGVYDTDAKRVFNGVKVEDVYTHTCAAEMAIGVLNNSNATIAISVTGNAMPYNDHADMLGEVFIGIAGYDNNDNIFYTTESINSCIENNNSEFKNLCKTWYDTASKGSYNSRSDTAAVSQEIRYYTAYKALELCEKFVRKYKPSAPLFIAERKNNIMLNIPLDKYPNDNFPICKNKDNKTASCNDDFLLNSGKKRYNIIQRASRVNRTGTKSTGTKSTGTKSIGNKKTMGSKKIQSRVTKRNNSKNLENETYQYGSIGGVNIKKGRRTNIYKK